MSSNGRWAGFDEVRQTQTQESVPKGCWPNTARPPPRLTPYTHTVIFPFRDLAADLLSRTLHSSRNYISRIKERANLRHFELFWSEPNRNGIARGEMIGSLSSIRAALKGLEEWVYDQGKTYTSWEQDKLGSRRWLEWRSARVQVVEGLWLKEWAADERPYGDGGAEKRSGGLDDRYGSSVGDGRTMASKADDWRDGESAARRKRRRSSIPPPAYSDDETYGRRSSTSTRSEREKPSRRRTAVKQRSSGSSTKPTTEDVRIRCEITLPSSAALLFLPAAPVVGFIKGTTGCALALLLKDDGGVLEIQGTGRNEVERAVKDVRRTVCRELKDDEWQAEVRFDDDVNNDASSVSLSPRRSPSPPSSPYPRPPPPSSPSFARKRYGSASTIAPSASASAIAALSSRGQEKHRPYDWLYDEKRREGGGKRQRGEDAGGGWYGREEKSREARNGGGRRYGEEEGREGGRNGGMSRYGFDEMDENHMDSRHAFTNDPERRLSTPRRPHSPPRQTAYPPLSSYQSRQPQQQQQQEHFSSPRRFEVGGPPVHLGTGSWRQDQSYGRYEEGEYGDEQGRVGNGMSGGKR